MSGIARPNWKTALPYFTERELQCKCGCKTIELDLRFAAALPALRAAWENPLNVNSCCRCREHNESVGGHPRSLHLTDNPVHPSTGTAAADIAWRGWPTQTQLRLARLAWSMGWSIGLHDGFIHVDIRSQLGLAQSTFIYGRWSYPFDAAEVTHQ